MSFYSGLLGGLVGGEVLGKIFEAVVGKAEEKVLEKVGERLPMFLGLSLGDERMWAQLWTLLDDEERKNLTTFLMGCKDYERNSFRHVVVGISASEDKTIVTGYGKGKKTEVIKTPHALSFLKIMAKVIKDLGQDEARQQCIAGGIIIPDPLFQKVIGKWGEAVKWFREIGLEKVRKSIIDQFGVNSLVEITPEIIIKKVSELASHAGKIDRNLASKIPTVERRGFFAEAFGWMVPNFLRRN